MLAQVNALDTRFGALVDAWDGAKIQLSTTEKQLAANRAQLSVAQKQSLIAQRRAAQLLVTIYEGESPDLIQLLVGSSKLSDVINAVQYTRDVAAAEQHVAAAAVRARDRLDRRDRAPAERGAFAPGDPGPARRRARDHRRDAREAASSCSRRSSRRSSR